MPDAAPERTSGPCSCEAPANAVARAPGRTSETQPPGPSTENLRRIIPNVIEQRQPQIDLAGHRRDPRRRPGPRPKQAVGKAALGAPGLGSEDTSDEDPAEPG